MWVLMNMLWDVRERTSIYNNIVCARWMCSSPCFDLTVLMGGNYMSHILYLQKANLKEDPA